jgi:hypothetical protein
MDRHRNFGLKLDPEILENVGDTLCTLAIEQILSKIVFSVVLILAVGNGSRDEGSFSAILDHTVFA